MLLLCILVGGVSNAWAADQTITLTYNSFGLTTSYSEKTATVSGFGFAIDQGYKGSGNVIQMNSSKGNGILYNTTAIPGLKSIKVTVSSVNKTYTITTGTSEKPTANSQTGSSTGTYNAASGDTFFQLKVSGACYFSSIEITYTPTHTLTYSATNGSIGGLVYNTSTAVASGASVAEGGMVTLTAQPEDGYEFTGWNVTGTGSSLSSPSTNPTTFTMGTENATVTATFEAVSTTKVITPTFTVEEGTYNVAQSVKLSCKTDGATIYYTTNGDTPTSSSTEYTGSAIAVNTTTTIKAIAVKNGLDDSEVASAIYTLKCVAPSFDPVAGSVGYGTEITLSTTTEGVTLYYTTNGDTPTSSSSAYDSSNKPTVSGNQTFKAIATKTGWSDSDVSSAAYTYYYVITVQSNNVNYGKVSGTTTITAIPEEGYRVVAGDGGYTVTNGSATVTNNGDNTFTVEAASNCTVQINFEAIPTHTVTFSINGDVSRTATVQEDAAITFPTAVASPSDAMEFPKTSNGKTFVGWYTSEYTHASTAPSYVNTSTAKMSTSDVTYYAVFADVSGSAVTDELTRETTGVTKNSNTYSNWSGKEGTSGAVYAGNSAGGNDAIQLRTNYSNSGIVTTTTGGNATKVTVSWNSNTGSRKLDIYGKTSAYSEASDLYGDSKGTSLGSLYYNYKVNQDDEENTTTTELTITGNYPFIGLRSNDGAMYLDEVDIEWSNVTYSNYCTSVVVTYSVTYDGNGNTSGNVPTDNTAYTSGQSVTVAGNNGSLAKTGYAFGGWNTQADGQGTNYAADATFSITANTTLYAKWNAKTITGLSYTGTPTKTSYIVGESFDPTGLTVTATYNDASQEDVTALVAWTPDPLTKGTTSVTGTYMEQTVNVTGLTVKFNPGSITISADDPVNVIATGDSDDLALTYENITISQASDFAVQFYDANDDELQNGPDWIEVAVEAATPSGYKVSYVVGANDGATRSAYFKVLAEDKNEDFAYSNKVTITQAAYVPAVTYTLATSVVPGRHYIIVGVSSNKYKALTTQGTNNRSAKEVTVTNNSTTISSEDGIHELLLSLDDKTGYFTLLDESTDAINGGYLYAASSSSNYLRTQTTNDANGKWSILIDNNGVATIKAQGTNTRNWMQYNAQSSIISCYSGAQANVYLFERDGDTGTQDFTASINAACTDGEGNYYGTYSAPFAFTVPNDVTVSEIAVDNNALVLEGYEAGAVIPANTGVLISSTTAGNKTFTSAKGGTSVLVSDNALRPSYWGITAKEMGDADANCLYYRLTMHNGTQLGFWWGAENGAAFALAANKAYLAVPNGAGVREGLWFGDDATSISEECRVKSDKFAPAIYDLQGRKVAQPKKGLYIVNGRKVVMK